MTKMKILPGDGDVLRLLDMTISLKKLFIICVFVLSSSPLASGLIHQYQTILLLCAQDRAQLSGQAALVHLGQDELLGDELPRGFAHDQLRHGALAPVPSCSHHRPQHRLHVSRQCHHESRGPFVQKDVGWKFAAERPLRCFFFFFHLHS